MENLGRKFMSKKRNDFNLLQQMLHVLNNFKINKSSLNDLIFDLNNLEGQLKFLENSWKEAIKIIWLDLEAISGTIDFKTNDLNPYSEEEKKAILDTVEELKKKISKKMTSFSLGYCMSCGYDVSDSMILTRVPPSKNVCDCCGLSLGQNENSLEKIRKYRNEWLQHPMLWHNPQAMPENWKLEDQMEHIPPQYL